MVATIGPASYNLDETLTTLRYANRAKNIKNKPKINEDPKDALLRTFQEEINRLKTSLENKMKGGGRTKSSRGKSGRGRRRLDENGDEIVDADDPNDIEEFMKKEQEKLEIEKTHIMNDHSLIGNRKKFSFAFVLFFLFIWNFLKPKKKTSYCMT